METKIRKRDRNRWIEKKEDRDRKKSIVRGKHRESVCVCVEKWRLSKYDYFQKTS